MESAKTLVKAERIGKGLTHCVLTILLAGTFGCTGTGNPEANDSESSSQASFKVAAIQAISEMGHPAANRTHLEALVREAARNGAKVVVLPEAAIPGYMSWDLKTTWQAGSREVTKGLKGTSLAEVAETVPGTSTKVFARLARELKVYLTVPIVEVDAESGRYYNTLVLMGPEGTLLAHYRKINPWPYAERAWASKSDFGNVFIDTPYGRMGLLICYDINFEPPNLKQLEVDHLLYSIAWVDSENSTWFDEKLPRIAQQNNLNIIGANWTVPEGQKPGWHGYGHSLIINRQGQTLARVSRDIGEQMVYAELAVVKKTGSAKTRKDTNDASKQ